MNFNTSPIAFYTNRASQPFRASYRQKEIAVQCGETLLPFYIPNVSDDAPDTCELYDPNTDTLIATLTCSPHLLTHTTTVNGVSVKFWIYQGTQSGIFGNSKQGYFYLKIGSYYSDIFRVGALPAEYTEVSWQFFDDIITVDGSLISKYVVYKQIFNVPLWKPTYNVEEEGKTNNGVFFAMQQTTKKTCGFSAIVNEAQADVMNLARMADYINVKSCINGQIKTFQTNQFEITAKWESDDVAHIECEFDLFNIVRKYQLSENAPEPLPIPVPPPPPSNYIIKGKATGTTVHLKINGTDTALPVNNGEFYYSYDTPLQSFSTYNNAGSTDVPTAAKRLSGVENITELDCSQSCGFSAATLVSFYGMAKCSKADFSNCTFASAENINGFLENAELLTDLKLPDATFANVKMCIMMFLGCKEIANISIPNAAITNIQGPLDGVTIIGNTSLFSNCKKLKSINMPLCTFEHATNTGAMFENCESLETITMSAATFADATSFNTMFAFAHYVGGSFNFGSVFPACTAAPTGINSMFYGAKIESVNLSAMDATALTSMSWAFYDSSLHTLTMNAAQFANVTNFERCFANCDIDETTNTLLSAIDFSAATNVKEMFMSAGRYQINGTVNFAAATFANVTNAQSMFEGSKFTNILMPLATFASLTNANKMFYGSNKATTIDLSTADFSAVTDVANIFNNCNALIHLDVPNNDSLPLSISLAQSASLDVDSFTAIADWCADVSGGTAQKLTVNATARSIWNSGATIAQYNAAVSVLTGKNWTLQ